MNFILIHMVPVDGLEPSLPQRNRILNPACLPIPPHWQVLGLFMSERNSAFG